MKTSEKTVLFLSTSGSDKSFSLVKQAFPQSHARLTQMRQKTFSKAFNDNPTKIRNLIQNADLIILT